MKDGLEALEGVRAPSMKDFWSWVRSTFTISYQDEIEDYLSQSVDRADFEYRMRVLRTRGML